MAPATPSKYAGEAFPAPRAVTQAAVEAGADAAGAAPAGAGWVQTTLSLALVLGLVLALAWLYRKLAGNHAANPAAAAAVIGRSVVSPKHGVVLLRVGRRVLICAESAGHPLAPLDTITDPDEVAELVGNLRGAAAGRPFRQTLEETYPPPEQAEIPAAMDSASTDPAIESTRGEIAGLLDKVRRVSGQMSRT